MSKMASIVCLSRETWVTVIKALAALVLTILLLIHVRNNIQKFFRAPSIFVTSHTKSASLSFPDVTLCPRNGYKFDRLIRMGLSENQWIRTKMAEEDFRMAENRHQLDWWWNETTFKLADFVTSFFIFHDDGQLEHIDVQDDLTAENMTIFATNTETRGRCYTLHSTFHVISVKVYLALFFKITDSTGPIDLFVHEHGAEKLGAPQNYYWPGSVDHLVINSDEHIDLSIIKSVTVKKDPRRHCQTDMDTLKYSQCCIDLMTAALSEGGHQSCYWPQLYKSVIDAHFEPCHNLSQLNNISEYVSDFLDDNINLCLLPCHATEYDTKIVKTQIPGVKSGDSLIYIYYKDDWIETREEFELVDSDDILASVGGSMSLFLGFSLLHYIFKFIDKADGYCRNFWNRDEKRRKIVLVKKTKPTPKHQPRST